jgi:hypothetical protein
LTNNTRHQYRKALHGKSALRLIWRQTPIPRMNLAGTPFDLQNGSAESKAQAVRTNLAAATERERSLRLSVEDFLTI